MAGRPRLHPNQAEKQFAYRQRKRAERDDELSQLAAWQRVREAAIASCLIGDDASDAEASESIAIAINR